MICYAALLKKKCRLCSRTCQLCSKTLLEIMLVNSTAVNHSGFRKLTDSSRVRVYMLALTSAELVKWSRSDGTAGSLPVLVLPGSKSLTELLSLSYTLETLAKV